MVRSHALTHSCRLYSLEKFDDLDLWAYGPVNVRQVASGFVFQVGRTNRSVVFLNVCANKYVPLVDEGTDIDATDALFFVVGVSGKTEEGLDVYDVTVHPRVVERCKQSDAVAYKRTVSVLLLHA